MTFEELQALPSGEVFATGELPNSPEGIYMTTDHVDQLLRWVAKKGWGYSDWAIYCHWAEIHDVEWIKEHGDKVTSKINIQRCVPCTEEMFKHYRL